MGGQRGRRNLWCEAALRPPALGTSGTRPAPHRQVYMDILALLTWITTVAFGLYLLTIWLIEYDSEFQSATATRLPVPVISGHVLLAASGLVVWVIFLIYDKHEMAWIALAILGCAATLGAVMAMRWGAVYRSKRAAILALRATEGQPDEVRARAAARLAVDLGPPERNFPLTVVIAHGTFAVITVTLVVLTAFKY